MQGRTIRPLTYGPKAGPELEGKPCPVGTIIEHPKAWRTVLHGDYMPHDEECFVRCYEDQFPADPVCERLSEEQRTRLAKVSGKKVPPDETAAVELFRRHFKVEPLEKYLSDEQRARIIDRVKYLIHRQNPVCKGIAAEDYEDFYAGRMVGYDPETGKPIPGPNAEYDGPLELPT